MGEGHGNNTSPRTGTILFVELGCGGDAAKASLQEVANGKEASARELSHPAQPRRVVAVKILGLVVTWWSTAVLITLQIKTLIGAGGSFPYTFALTGLINSLSGMLAGALACTVLASSPPAPSMQWHEVAKLFMIGAIQGIEYGCGNKSLDYLSISARTMFGSITVLMMMLTARFWGLERLDLVRLVVASLLVTGGALQGLDINENAKHAESSSYARGICLQFVAMLAASQRVALVQFVTQRSPHGSALAHMSKSKVHLVKWTYPITGIVCFAFSFAFEMDGLESARLFQGDLTAKVLMLAAGVVVVTIAELEIVRVTSAVALAVLGTVHQIPIAMAGIVFFGDRVRPLRAVGFASCVLGGLCYAMARHFDGYVRPHCPAVGGNSLCEDMGKALVQEDTSNSFI